MAAVKRPKMSFELPAEAPPAIAAAPVAPVAAVQAEPAALAAPQGRGPGRPKVEREGERAHLGGRIDAGVYRRLKAHAAMTGQNTQDLIERAILEWLERAGA